MANFNISLSPAQSEYVLKPGVTILQAYDIVNNSDSNIILNTEVLPFIPSGTDGSVNYYQAVTNPDLEFSLANSDLKIGQPFVLKAHSKQQLVLKIKSNSNINLADNYYTFFVFQNQNITKSTDNFTQASGKIGSHLLLTVSDIANPKVKAVIQNFSISPKIKDVFFRPITFTGLIKNNSNFFFKATGKITITKNNKIIKILELDSSNVLNHHRRDISCKDSLCSLKPPLWPGSYKLKVELDPSLNANSYETSFFVFPFSPILFLILLITLIFIFRHQKKYRQN